MKSPEKPNYDSLPTTKIREQYDRLRKKTLIRLLVIYILPLILLSVYFHLQFTITLTESSKSHLKSIAESQRNTIDRLCGPLSFSEKRDYSREFWFTSLIKGNRDHIISNIISVRLKFE